MTRLIDADALKEYIDAQKGRPFIGCTIGEALKIMTDEQPTIEAVPVRRGRWIRAKCGDYSCSECEVVLEDDEPLFNYCPNCGARMDEE